MATFNVVRFRIKPGREAEFLDAHRQGKANWPGLARGHIIKTGDHAYCLIGEWADLAALKGARDQMIATLNSFRDTLEDLGGGLGVTEGPSLPRCGEGYGDGGRMTGCKASRRSGSARLSANSLRLYAPHPCYSPQGGGVLPPMP